MSENRDDKSTNWTYDDYPKSGAVPMPDLSHLVDAFKSQKKTAPNRPKKPPKKRKA